jgi:hypothetical protein
MREVCGCKKSCPEHLVPVSYFESYWEGWKDSVLIMQDILRRCAYGCGEPGLMSVNGQTGPVSEPGCRTDQPSILRIGDAVEMAIYLIRMEKPRLMSTAFTAQR